MLLLLMILLPYLLLVASAAYDSGGPRHTRMRSARSTQASEAQQYAAMRGKSPGIGASQGAHVSEARL
jgi:hypothetical protein